MSQHRTLEQLTTSWDAFVRPKDGDRFQHYKGGHYEIIATGFLEASEMPCVIYRSLQNNSIWVRTAENFFENVEYDGEIMPRFQPTAA